VTEGFANPIVGGGGALVYPSIHSPDYVPGVSGWSIDRDGNAEFNSITLPPGTGGATIFAQAATPSAHAAGDLWINTGNANEVLTSTAAGSASTSGPRWRCQRGPDVDGGRVGVMGRAAVRHGRDPAGGDHRGADRG
jgi:hypothetical protein